MALKVLVLLLLLAPCVARAQDVRPSTTDAVARPEDDRGGQSIISSHSVFSSSLGGPGSFSSSSSSSNGCNIQDDQVLVNGQPVRNLTVEEKRQLADYGRQIDEYFRAIFSSQFSGFGFGGGLLGEDLPLLGRERDRFKAVSTSKSRPTFPKFPEICKESELTTSEHHVTILDGCSVRDGQIYVNGKPLKQLTDSQNAAIARFNKEMQTFREELANFVREQVGTALSGRGQSSLQQQPTPPETPRNICPESASTTMQPSTKKQEKPMGRNNGILA